MTTYHLTTPIKESDIRELKAGDEVFITGKIATGRDAVHTYLHGGGECPIDLTDGIIYHCGPVVIGDNGNWAVKAAGPTTSIREEPFQADVIEKLKLRGIIGKGGMGKKTLDACSKFGAVYLHAVGGAAQVYSDTVVKVHDVHLTQFGSPEAMWIFEVKDFPCVVTMDSHGKSLHEQVKNTSLDLLKKYL